MRLRTTNVSSCIAGQKGEGDGATAKGGGVYKPKQRVSISSPAYTRSTRPTRLSFQAHPTLRPKGGTTEHRPVGARGHISYATHAIDRLSAAAMMASFPAWESLFSMRPRNVRLGSDPPAIVSESAFTPSSPIWL